MDALCLFDPGTLRVLSVDGEWVRRFGWSAEDARSMGIGDLAGQGNELAHHARNARWEGARLRGAFRRRAGHEFFADYTIALHDVGQGTVGSLQVDAQAVGDWASDARTLARLEEEEADQISQVTVPPHLKAAMRERLARCARQQSALLALASLDDRDLETLMRRLLRTDSDTLDVARVSWWRLKTDGSAIVCETLFDRRTGEFTSGFELKAAEYPKYFRALVTGALIPAHDAVTDPRTSEFAVGYLQPLGIGAMLDIPVFLRGELVGIVCHEHVGGARGWTMDEQQFALSVGQLVSLTLAGRHREDAARSIRQREAQLSEAHAGLERALRPGDGRLTGRVLGRYRMMQTIGRGGMGEVYKAQVVDDRTLVAVKVLHPSLRSDDDNVQRLFREARLTASVPSEHVAKVLEVGYLDDDSPFIAMELLEGHDLAWHLRRNPLLPLAEVVELVDHAARALAAVRRAGVVHRDLKPHNLFLVDAIPRQWKVLDFGLSRSETDPFMTSSGVVAGTPQYMAPERLVGEAADHRADLYALAAIAYRCLAGRAPFVGDVTDVLSAILTEAPPPISSLVGGVPIELDPVFAVALARDPDQRFALVEELAEALRGASEGVLDPRVRTSGWKLIKSAQVARRG